MLGFCVVGIAAQIVVARLGRRRTPSPDNAKSPPPPPDKPASNDRAPPGGSPSKHTQTHQRNPTLLLAFFWPNKALVRTDAPRCCIRTALLLLLPRARALGRERALMLPFCACMCVAPARAARSGGGCSCVWCPLHKIAAGVRTSSVVALSASVRCSRLLVWAAITERAV